jgi:putative acetyltransferase
MAIVRRAVEADASAIASVLLEAFAEFRPLYTPEGFAATALGENQVLDRLREGPAWVAESDGRILGTVSAVLRGTQCYLRGMAVVPAARRQAIGPLLLRAVEEFAASAGANELALSTTPFLHRAIHLYERAGFRRTAAGPADLFGTPLFTMTKTR